METSDALLLENLKKMAESAANEAAAQQASLVGCSGTNGQNNNDIFAPDKLSNRKTEERMEVDENDLGSRGVSPLPQENHINGAHPEDGIPPEVVNTQHHNGSPELPHSETNEHLLELDNKQSQKTDSEHHNSSSPMPVTSGSTSVTPGNSSRPHTPGNNSSRPVTPGSGGSRPVTPGNSSRPLTPGSNSSRPMTPHTPQESGKRSDDLVQCGECSKEFTTMEDYMDHDCSDPKKSKNIYQNEILSDAESFDGKIVYNPDGSAYIIEGESDISDSDSLIDVPQQEGSIIVDSRGKVNTTTIPSFPQSANAFYIQRNPAAFYNTFYMCPPESRPRPAVLFDVKYCRNMHKMVSKIACGLIERVGKKPFSAR